MDAHDPRSTPLTKRAGFNDLCASGLSTARRLGYCDASDVW
ncbi:2-methylisocitrate lyase-like PEP mutase family enzyme [Bradyrhizobium sp. USDA 4461]